MPYLTKQMILDLPTKETAYKVTDAVMPGKTKSQGVPGLCVRVCPGGAKTFAIQYRTKTGRKGWYPLGRFGVLTLDQARDEASKKLLAVANGEDPGAQLRADRDALTVAQLVAKFCTDYLPSLSERSQSEYKRLLTNFVVPRLGTRKAREVGTGDMYDLLLPIRKETPVQANRVLAVARKMFNWAEVSGDRDPGTNPMLRQAWTTETARERRMVEAEVRALGQMIQEVEATTAAGEVDGATLQPESVHALAAVKLYLLAAFRKEEVLDLRWAWIDMEKGVVRIPPEFHKTGRKTGKARIVYLPPAAVAVLRALPRLDADEEAKDYNPHVIVGKRRGAGLVQIQDVWERLRAAVTDRAKHEAKKAKKKVPAVSIVDVTIHDLRRTFASVAADLGHPELIIKALLGHQSLGSVTEVYTRLSVDPIRAAVDEVGGAIAVWMGMAPAACTEAEQS